MQITLFLERTNIFKNKGKKILPISSSLLNPNNCFLSIEAKRVSLNCTKVKSVGHITQHVCLPRTQHACLTHHEHCTSVEKPVVNFSFVLLHKTYWPIYGRKVIVLKCSRRLIFSERMVREG